MYCDICGRGFTLKRKLKRHKKTHEKSRKYKCGKCSKCFRKECNKKHHEKNCRGYNHSNTVQPKRNNKVEENRFKIEKVSSAFKNASVTWKLIYSENDGNDYADTMNTSCLAMTHKLEDFREENHSLKFNIS